MLEKIKKVVFSKYKKTDTNGIFFSALDKDNNLILSNGVVFSDKSLEQTIETIYHGLIEKHKNIETIIIDIVIDTKEITNPKEIQNISLQEYGLLLITENKSGILLPNTEGVENISTALKIIKEKNGLEGNAKITTFQTDRFIT
ncbi:MAG TPA: AMMECR1 domain-containing protein [Candidatus Absconditabacterales bacterium]|nr:AMMECR1 domain-containing protein [Candidatus Absconditabacterales bacterium]